MKKPSEHTVNDPRQEMIAASVYLDRWRSDVWPDAKWCACDIDRIKAIQKDSLESALSLVANCCQVSPSEAHASLYSVCAQLQDAIDKL